MDIYQRAIATLRDRYCFCIANVENRGDKILFSGWMTPVCGHDGLNVSGGFLSRLEHPLSHSGVGRLFRDDSFSKAGLKAEIAVLPKGETNDYFGSVVVIEVGKKRFGTSNRIGNTWVIPFRGDFAVPPSDNVVRVTGKGSHTHYLFGGATHAYRLVKSVEYVTGLGVDDFTDVADWGCGAARLTQHFARMFSGRVIGIDVDPINVEWCNKNVPQISVQQIGWNPPTTIETGRFDLLFAYSVFSHIAEESISSWVAEINRVLRPDGIAVITTLGMVSTASRRAPQSFFEKLEKIGFVEWGNKGQLDDVRPSENSYLNIAMMPEFAYRKFAEQFEVLALLEGLGPQDAWILRKR